MSVTAVNDERADTLSLSSLLKHGVVDGEGRTLGKLLDVITTIRDGEYPLLEGFVVGIAGTGYYIPMADVVEIDPKKVRLRTAKIDLRPFMQRDGELLLRKNVLGHRLIDVGRSALVRAYDVRLAPTSGGWRVTGLDVHKGSWFYRGRHAEHSARDWRSFLLVIGDTRESGLRALGKRLKRLSPAQIADIIESASAGEQDALLAQVHEDPELEADVFEELDDNKQAKLLGARSDGEVAELLGRMRADDAADAIMDLAQARRKPVLNLLPDLQKMKVMTLLGFNEATAGGLMGSDFVALDEMATVADALAAVRSATALQPEALTVIHVLREDKTLRGTLSLVRAVQSDADTLLSDAVGQNLVVASPDDDIVTVTTRMADYNLLSLPVVGTDMRMLGVVTVDDALEAAIPRDWTRRSERR
ncbi:MAG: CBS domain-containing protein [Pseudomonadota bacterium]|nr:CBS domain-containing protein [Pseudomonadota bacterium]